MRLIKPVDYTRATQALARGACPICILLKNAQSEELLELSSIEGFLCNFHTWALAAGKNGAQVANLFLQLLETEQSHRGRSTCGVCDRLRDEEHARVKELSEQLAQSRVREWMQKHGTLCVRHAFQLRAALPPVLRPEIDKVRERNSAELKTELEHLRDHLSRGEHAGAGVLGKAAEFLVSQRGMQFGEDEKC